MFDDAKPSLDELAHYGVAGMKWGKHRVKADAHDIHAARNRVRTESNKLESAQKSAASIKDKSKREAAKSDVAKMKTDFLKNPDRVTASRLTRGEKVITALLLTPVGAGAIIGITSASSRRIEQKQDKGKYNK